MSFVDARRCKRTLLTNEKRFCLDGPNGTACFWGDKLIHRSKVSKKQRCGGVVMVQADI